MRLSLSAGRQENEASRLLSQYPHRLPVKRISNAFLASVMSTTCSDTHVISSNVNPVQSVSLTSCRIQAPPEDFLPDTGGQQTMHLTERVVQNPEAGRCCSNVQEEVGGEEHEGGRIQWKPTEGWKHRCIDPESLS